MNAVRIAAAVVGCLCALVTGCDDRDREVRYVQVESGHRCGVNCHEHHYDGKRIVVTRRHRHGPGCGHEWDGANWVIVRAQRVAPRGHRCTVDCDHHYDRDGRVVTISRHRHGPGCGHVYDGHRWVVAERRRR